MKIQSYQCDECGVVKQKSNHWVVGYASGAAGAIYFWPWSEDAASGEAIHLCGAGCAGKVLDRQIAKWKEKA